jgi:hypothetical protein
MIRFRPVVALFVLMSLFGASGSWHVVEQDPDFLPQVAGHDHSHHDERWRPRPAAAGAPDHCTLCHWAQAFSAGRTEKSDSPPVVGADGQPRLASVQPIRSTILFQRSPRGPPA